MVLVVRSNETYLQVYIYTLVCKLVSYLTNKLTKLTMLDWSNLGVKWQKIEKSGDVILTKKPFLQNLHCKFEAKQV